VVGVSLQPVFEDEGDDEHEIDWSHVEDSGMTEMYLHLALVDYRIVPLTIIIFAS
jgi:hypothetical protein